MRLSPARFPGDSCNSSGIWRLSRSMSKQRKVHPLPSCCNRYVEIWVATRSEDYGTDYLISNHGRVYSLKRRRILEGSTDDQGYLRCSFYKYPKKSATQKFHRLVAEAFIGNPPSREAGNVLHWDDDKTNNHVHNLRYGTKADNMDDRVRNGLSSRDWTKCIRGHAFTDENTIWRKRDPGGLRMMRRCRTCERKRLSDAYQKKKAEGAQ